MATQDRFYSNTAVPGTIGNSGGISNAATSLFLSATPSGYPSSYPFLLVLSPNGSINAGQAPEAVLVTAGAGTSGSPWTVTRGVDGTTAAAWGQNANVTHEADAQDFTLSSLHRGSVLADLPHGLPASAWATASFAAISETSFASAGPSVSISSIPQTYKHLLLVINARISETSVQADDIACVLNGDTGSFYSYVTSFVSNISGAGTGTLSPGQFSGFAGANWPIIRVAASLAGTSANVGGGFAWLPNYTSTTFNKMFMSLSGAGDGSTAMVDSRTRMGWYNPAAQAAVTSMTLTAPGASNFNVGSFVGLYGIA